MAAGSTYTPISTNTLGSAQSSVTFSSISGAYTDLVLIISGQVSFASSFNMRVNSDSNSNYSNTLLYTDGTSTPGSVRGSNQTQIDYASVNGIGITSYGVYTPIIVNIMNYANTTTYKTFIGTNRTASGGYLGNADITEVVSLWRNTNAITSITVFPSNSANWTTGSTFTLYGILAA
jgi:hypothetical protein